MQNTLHYNLPLFEGEDVPSIIGQWNPTMQLLDTKLYQLSIGNAGPEIIHEIEALIATVNDLIATVNETISDVNELQQTINAVQQTVSSIYEALGQYAGDIAGIQASIGTLTETVGTLNSAVTSMQGEISGIDERVTTLENAPGYTLPTASANELGGVKVGTGLSIDGNGVLSNDNPTPATPYVLPIASQNTLGGIKVGQNLTIESDGTLNASGGSSEPDISHGPVAGTFKFSQVQYEWFDIVGNFSLTLPIGFRIFANGNASISFNKMLYGTFDGSNWTLTGDQSSEILSLLDVTYWDTTTQSAVTAHLTELVNNSDLLFFKMGNLGNYEQVYFNVKNSNDDEVNICEAPMLNGAYAGEFINLLFVTLVLDNLTTQLRIGKKGMKKFSKTFHSDVAYSEIEDDQEIEITDMGTYLESQQILKYQDHSNDFIHFANQYGTLPDSWAESDESFIPFRDDISSITNVTVDNDSSRVSGSDSDYYGELNLTFDNLEIYKVKSEYIDRFTQPV